MYSACQIHKHWYCTNFCFLTCFLVFCQLSVFHGSFNKHYPGWLFWVAICQSNWSTCFLVSREYKPALFEFGCVSAGLCLTICFIPSLVLPSAVQWKRLGIKQGGVPDENKEQRGREFSSSIWKYSLRIFNLNWSSLKKKKGRGRHRGVEECPVT